MRRLGGGGWRVREGICTSDLDPKEPEREMATVVWFACSNDDCRVKMMSGGCG